MAQHIITGSGAPTSRPEHPGQHYIDESADPRVTYIGLSTDPETPVSECWQEVGAGGDSGGGGSSLSLFEGGAMLVPENGGNYIHAGQNTGQTMIDLPADVATPFECRVRSLNWDHGVAFSGLWDNQFFHLGEGLNADTAGEINVDSGYAGIIKGIDVTFALAESTGSGPVFPPGETMLVITAHGVVQLGGGEA